MMDTATWQEQNTQHLTTALAGIRVRLQQHARPDPSSALTPEPIPVDETRSPWRLFGRKQVPPAVTRPALPAAPDGASALSGAIPLAESSTDLAAAPALVTLTERLGLTSFERDLLLLCAGMELDTGFASLCARALDPDKPYPTFALALTVLRDPAWEALSPERPLRYFRLIDVNQPGNQLLTTSALRADERIVNYLKGLNYLDDRLASLLVPFDAADPRDLLASQQHVVGMIDAQLNTSPGDRRLPVVQLLGRDPLTKALVAGVVAARLGLRVFRLQLGAVPSQPADLEAFARLWHRESMLLPAALYVEGETGDIEGTRAQAIQYLLTRLNAVVFLDTQDLWQGLGASTVAIEVDKPTPAEQEGAWADTLGDAAGESPALLAGQFDLSVPSIREIARQARLQTDAAAAVAEGDPPSLHQQLWQGALAAARPRLDALAQRIEPKACWDDLVLPDAEMALLRQIAAQVGKRSTVYDAWGFREKTSRGLGISALFCGESGTGKTMAAEVLASHLQLHVHRIDLSAVVSKYIGQTEKNLRRLFDAAEDGGAVLFFDEADALFGKRSEVKDSHDRYANIEVNYLLQRMEAFRGLAILATNMRSALDAAFLRRLRFVVTFPFPGVAERRSIWQKVFPQKTPTSGLDFERLARLNVTGGHVHNIAMNAAFLAAQAGTPVTMPIVLASARTEFRKLERPINEADFRWQARPEAVA